MPRVSRYAHTLNKAQQHALKNVFDRGPIYRQISDDPFIERPVTYRQFRKSVRYDFLCDCAMVQWCGMMLGIETDGYTHS
jgi:hypothetical protein